MSPDGKLIFTAHGSYQSAGNGDQAWLKLWDADTGDWVRQLHPEFPRPQP